MDDLTKKKIQTGLALSSRMIRAVVPHPYGDVVAGVFDIVSEAFKSGRTPEEVYVYVQGLLEGGGARIDLEKLKKKVSDELEDG